MVILSAWMKKHFLAMKDSMAVEHEVGGESSQHFG
jgi:hypothetical protein